MIEPRGQAGERRFDVRWFFWAGHHTEGAVRGHTISCGIHGMVVSVPEEYDLHSFVEFELWLTATRCITVVGKIVQKMTIQSGYGYEVAFHSIPQEDRQYLADVFLAMRRAEFQLAFQ